MSVITDYIATFEGLQLQQLQHLYRIIKKAAPRTAEECISYGMPTFKYLGNLIHFSVYSRHMGFYPGTAAIIAFKDKLEAYKTSKGAIQFPLSSALPVQLIQDIVKFCITERERSHEKKQVSTYRAEKTRRTCPEGHHYYKSSECNTCPRCMAASQPKAGFLSSLSGPARNALEAAGITTVKILSRYTEKDILALHGIGKASLPALHRALEERALSFAAPAKK